MASELVPADAAARLAHRDAMIDSLQGKRVPAITAAERELVETRALYDLCLLYVRAGDMLPKAYRPQAAYGRRAEVTEEQAAAKLLVVAKAGQPFGWDALTSVRMLDNIDGQTKLKTEALIALVRKAGHRIDIDDTGDRVSVVGKRRDDGSEMRVEWSAERARSVPHTKYDGDRKIKSDLWTKWVESGQTAYMLRWRALSELGRFLFGDVTLGLAGDWEDVPADESPLALDAPEQPVGTLTERVLARTAAALAPPAEPDEHTQAAAVDPADVPTMPDAGDLAAWTSAARAHKVTLAQLIQRWGEPLGVRNWPDVAEGADEVRHQVWDWLQAGAGDGA